MSNNRDNIARGPVQITLADFLYSDQIEEVFRLKNAKEICEKVIRPNIEEINFKLGQENDPMYLAYACEFVVTMYEKSKQH